jgi:hypothetical protein
MLELICGGVHGTVAAPWMLTHRRVSWQFQQTAKALGGLVAVLVNPVDGPIHVYVYRVAVYNVRHLCRGARSWRGVLGQGLQRQQDQARAQ